jgi:hypothetical protein
MRLAAAIFAIFWSTACAAQSFGPGMGHSQGHSQPPATATVYVDLTRTGLTIPQNFVGFSVENSDFEYGYFTASNTTLIGMLQRIGANGVLRIGGNTQDVAVTAPSVTTTNMGALAGFISAVGPGWTTIWGLDGLLNNASVAATQASTIATALGVNNVVFQFTNEPVDSSNFTTSTFASMWNAYYTAVTSAVPGVKLAAWDDQNFTSTPTVIPTLTPGMAGMTMITQHWYGDAAKGVNITASQLISQIAGANTNPFSVSLYQNNQWAGTIPQRLTESNSHAHGGQSGLSDTLAASAWYLNEAISFASHGWVGIDTHSVMNGTNPVVAWYNPLKLQPDSGWGPGPIFYGQYLFSRIEGQTTALVAITGGGVNALSTVGTNGNANIVVVNNNVYSPTTVTPSQSGAWTTAHVLLVQDSDGAGCASAAPLVGGQPIQEGGVWTGAPYTISNGQSVTLPPCGAALISILP